MTAEPESKTYQQMLNSVEQILSEISSDKIDMKSLASLKLFNPINDKILPLQASILF